MKSDRCLNKVRLPLKECSTDWPATKPQTRRMPFIFHKVFFLPPRSRLSSTTFYVQTEVVLGVKPTDSSSVCRNRKHLPHTESKVNHITGWSALASMLTCYKSLHVKGVMGASKRVCSQYYARLIRECQKSWKKLEAFVAL